MVAQQYRAQQHPLLQSSRFRFVGEAAQLVGAQLHHGVRTEVGEGAFDLDAGDVFGGQQTRLACSVDGERLHIAALRVLGDGAAQDCTVS